MVAVRWCIVAGPSEEFLSGWYLELGTQTSRSMGKNCCHVAQYGILCNLSSRQYKCFFTSPQLMDGLQHNWPCLVLLLLVLAHYLTSHFLGLRLVRHRYRGQRSQIIWCCSSVICGLRPRGRFNAKCGRASSVSNRFGLIVPMPDGLTR